MGDSLNARARVNVSVIGGYRATSEQADLAYRLGGELMRSGFNLITGGRKGVMEQVARGAREARVGRRGVIVGILPGDDRLEGNDYLDVAIPTGMGYLRNGLVVLAGDAVVAVGGRAGTLSEITLAWQMERPLCILGPGGWSHIAGTRIDDRRPHVIPHFRFPGEVIEWIAEVVSGPDREG